MPKNAVSITSGKLREMIKKYPGINNDKTIVSLNQALGDLINGVPIDDCLKQLCKSTHDNQEAIIAFTQCKSALSEADT